jgi:tetratricopeptide (TPR) repeat protein
MSNKVFNKTAAALVATVCLSFAVAGPAVADEAASGDALEKRDALVHKLLHESSAARKVMGSGNEAALAKREEALQIYEAASKHSYGDLREQQYNRAVALMYEAAALVNNVAGGVDKSQRDFDNRQQSLEALLDAHERIMDEKKTPKVHEALVAEIAGDLAAANALVAKGEARDAKVFLDRAYVATKMSLERARGGETLLRELNFETPKDEFEYELDRNDTHRMLLSVLLDEKMQNERIRNRVDELVAASQKLREQALAFAGNEEYKLAIETMEQSTKELVKAIRSAGVYIPG